MTLPALLAGLYFVLRRAPRILTTIWDALATQANLLAAAWSADDALGTATAAVQLLVLGLSGLGIGYLLYSLFVKPALAAARARSAVRRVGGSAAVLGAAAGLGLLWAPELPFARTAAPAGVQTFAVPSHREVQTPVRYSQAPPVGGDHSPVWQNCGFYSAPIDDEHGVGSLARGAVWITYQPGLDGRQLAILRRLARRDHVLVTPHRRLPAPVVASAWGRQLRLGAALDARLERFVRAYRLDAQAPETGRPCTGGKGEPR